jgi:Tol biopolymer transport system component
MSRLRFVPIVVGALVLHSAVLVAQQAPPLRTLVYISGDSVRQYKLSPNGRYILQSTRTSLGMYEVASRTSWNLADGEAWELNWSPRGDMIAYVRGGDGGSGEFVWAMPVDANTGRARGPAQRVTIGQGEFPSFSLDGRWIAFAGIDSGGASHLSILPVTGGPERVLARFPSRIVGIHWSADGRAIYLLGPAPGTSDFAAVLKVRVAGGAPEVIRSGDWFFPGMTADRRHLVLIHKKALVTVGDQATVVDTAGREVGHVPLPVGDIVYTDGVLGDSALVWVAVRDRSVIEIRPIAGGSARRLPLIGESNEVPLWSPDGTLIAFQVRENNRRSLAVINADGTNPRVFRESDVLADVWGAKWSPDSRLVAFLSPDRNRMSLLDVAAGASRTVLVDTANSIGAWQWRADGQAIVFVSIRRPTSSIDEVTVNGQRRPLLDWPVPTTPTNSQFVGDSSIFVRSDTAALLWPLGRGPARHLASVPPGSELYRPALSNDRRWIGGLLLGRDSGGATFSQVELFSLETGARTVLDLPFGWRTGMTTWAGPPEFLPGDNSLLVSGWRRGEPDCMLHRVPLNGDPPRAVANIGAFRQGNGLVAASASPDGRSVVYSVQPEPSAESLVLIDLRGAIPRPPSRPPRR